MFRFVKWIFVSAMILGCNLSSVNSLECVSITNQECKVRPEIVNSNESLFLLSSLFFFLLVLKQVNTVVVVTI